MLRRYIDEVNPISHGWIMEDYPMWLWISRESKIHFVNDITAVYRVLQKSVSHSDNLTDLIRFSHGVIDIQNFFYKKYTSINFDPELQKWTRTIMYYANYNKRKEFFDQWKQRRGTGRSFNIMEIKTLLVYVLMFIRIYPLVSYVKSRI